MMVLGYCLEQVFVMRY